MKRARRIRLPRLNLQVTKRGDLGWIFLVVATVAIGVGLALRFWEVLHSDEDSLSSTISNLSFVLGGIVAIELAVWRSIVGERQTTVAQRQVETAQSGLLNERFQKGAEMLGSEDLPVRLGGIYALQHLAAEHPQLYHLQIMKLLCAFVRHPTKNEDAFPEIYMYDQDPLADVVAVVEVICKRRSSQIEIERNAEFSLDLRNADLNQLSFGNADLFGADFFGAKLFKTSFAKANLSNAQFADAIFSDDRPPDLIESIMYTAAAANSHSDLREANLSGTSFSLKKGSHPARGLKQGKLNEACADPYNEPKLDGVLDVETDSPIVWGGKARKQK